MHSLFYRRTFQLATAALLAYALYEILSPLRSILGWAAVLAFIIHPLHERLARRLRGRPALSAGILTALTPFLVLAPLAVLGVVFAGQVARLIQYLRAASLPSATELLDRLAAYPLLGGLIGWIRENAAVSAADAQGWLTDSLQA
ncbi:MAG: AI-2E family transporter, partial [Gammaproteobacteria bacterium]|nr:AI-2E family transporter [Gammaproteobacteria bacterium]